MRRTFFGFAAPSAGFLPAAFRALVLTGALGACATAPSESVEAADDVGSQDDAVTDVLHSSVKDQATNNCWIYATVGWTESLVKTAGGRDLNLSESYLTYWNWFERILAGDVVKGAVEEGGSWGQAADLMIRYGLVQEKDFVPGEEKEALSARQTTALAAINKELASGSLKSKAARRDRRVVRAALDKAWKLDPSVRANLDATFGKDVSKNLAKNFRVALLPDGVPIWKPSDLKARLKNPTTGDFDDVTLADALGARLSDTDLDHRSGTYAWNDVAYPKTKPARRNFQKRVQRALADGQPVMINWMIDFNALTKDGKVEAPPAKPGSQGGHVTLLEDYEIENVPGFGTLPAGKLETRPAALEAALSDEATITFFRTKNSWGPTYRKLPEPAPGGYHDLYLRYLDGPVKACEVDKDENPLPDTCVDSVPFESVVLPAGY
ncbi:MAG: hypothetical protein U0169_21800 [Polyangiaceae bacterium]